MKLIELKCPNCGFRVEADAESKSAVCTACGTTFMLDDEVRHVKLDDAQKSGYEFELGRQKAKEDIKRRNTTNISFNKTRRLVESALMIALAVALNEFAVIKFPFGGSVTFFAQLPIVLLAYRYGTAWGLFSGFTMSIFEFIFGMSNLAYVTGIKGVLILILADYLFAFTSLGLGGIFKKPVKNQALALACGSALVSVIRFTCHFVSGVTIWGGYAPEGTPVWKYSLLYNGGYMLPELIITVIGALAVGSLFDLTRPDFFKRKHKDA